MSGLSDLHDYNLTDAERLALCAELERLNRSFPSEPAERGASMKYYMGYTVDAENGIIFGCYGKPIGTLTEKGYLKITVRKTLKPYRSHRLIWESVNGPIQDGMQINHINGIKTDNRIGNLELVTCSENIRHAMKTGLKKASGSSNGRAKISTEQAIHIKNSTQPADVIAAKFGLAKNTIHQIRRGARWSHLP